MPTEPTTSRLVPVNGNLTRRILATVQLLHTRYRVGGGYEQLELSFIREGDTTDIREDFDALLANGHDQADAFTIALKGERDSKPSFRGKDKAKTWNEWCNCLHGIEERLHAGPYLKGNQTRHDYTVEWHSIVESSRSRFYSVCSDYVCGYCHDMGCDGLSPVVLACNGGMGDDAFNSFKDDAQTFFSLLDEYVNGVKDWALENPQARGSSSEVEVREHVTPAKLHSADDEEPGNWLPATSMADLANRLGNVGIKKARTTLKQYGLKQAGNRQAWTVCLDGMPKNIREQLEKR
mgnify:CR=1 FL=1